MSDDFDDFNDDYDGDEIDDERSLFLDRQRGRQRKLDSRRMLEERLEQRRLKRELSDYWDWPTSHA